MEHSKIFAGRPSTRLHAQPGGNSSFNIFGSDAPAAEAKASPARAAQNSSNIFGGPDAPAPAVSAVRKGQGNASTLQLTDEPSGPAKPSTRVSATPGGTTHLNLFGGPEPAAAPAPAPAPVPAAPAAPAPAPVAEPEPAPAPADAAPADVPAEVPVVVTAPPPVAAPVPTAARTNNIFGAAPDGPAKSSTVRHFAPGGRTSVNIFGSDEPAAPAAPVAAPAPSPFADGNVAADKPERPRSGKKLLGPGMQATSGAEAEETFRPARKLIGNNNATTFDQQDDSQPRPTRKLLNPAAASAAPVVDEQPPAPQFVSGRKLLGSQNQASNIFADAGSDDVPKARARIDNNRMSAQSPWNTGAAAAAPTPERRARSAPRTTEKRSYFPTSLAFNSGYLGVDDTHKVYFEQYGNPNGQPAVFLHDGPGGAGINELDRRLFNPATYRIVLMDQRGAGKSTPSGSLNHSIWDLAADIEKLRSFLKIDQWVVVGAGFGATLALTYAIQNSDKVKGLIVSGVVSASLEELFYGYSSGVNMFFPEAWDRFVAPIPESERETLIDAYYKRLTGADEAERDACARAWIAFHQSIGQLLPDENPSPDEKCAVAAATTRAFYLSKNFFFENDWLKANVSKLAGIPGIIIHGRYDAIAPIKSAFDLHKNWPESEFIAVADAGHSSRESAVVHHVVVSTDRFAIL